MSFILTYIREKRRIIIMLLIFAAVFAVTFYLYRLPVSAVLYPTAICLLIGSVFAVSSFVRSHKKHKILCELKDRSDIVICSQIESFSSLFDNDYRSIIESICKSKLETEQQMTKVYDDMIDYYTTWVHQIKTPIASMRLRLKQEDTSFSRKLSSDLLHIEQYVEMVLTFLRMESDTTDYVFREAELDKILKDNLRRLRGDFIMKNISLNFKSTGVSVITDEKWLSFVIGQILDINFSVSSAIKSLGEDLFNQSISFSKLIESINTNLQITEESLNVFSVEGIIKGTTTISLVNLITVYAVRYVTIKILILISPFAVLSMCLENTSVFFKLWFRNLLSMLFIQIIVSIILLILFSVDYNSNDLMTKFMYIGGIYCLLKANSFVREFMMGAGISTSVQNSIGLVRGK